MTQKTQGVILLSKMADGREADIFVLMSFKEAAKTSGGKPFFWVGFRDADQEVRFPIWGDSSWSETCREDWQVGLFYKIRAIYRQTDFGPQLDIRKIRPVVEEDQQDGFDELMCLPRTRFDIEQMFADLVNIAKEEIEEKELSVLTVDILESHREQLYQLPAATRNHHAFLGGFLEHVLSVARNALFLADKYATDYADMTPPLSRDLVVSGAILHDIGKLRELELGPGGAFYRPEGELIGHILQGRDIVREAAAERDLAPETLLRLEHIIISHQRLPEWGSPKRPMTPEALLVHYADDIDAKFQMMYAALQDLKNSEAAFTSHKNPLGQKLYRGQP